MIAAAIRGLKDFDGRRPPLQFRFFEKRNDLLARHRREAVEKFFDRVSALKIIDQVLDRDACAGETRRAAHDFGIDLDDGTHWENDE